MLILLYILLPSCLTADYSQIKITKDSIIKSEIIQKYIRENVILKDSIGFIDFIDKNLPLYFEKHDLRLLKKIITKLFSLFESNDLKKISIKDIIIEKLSNSLLDCFNPNNSLHIKILDVFSLLIAKEDDSEYIYDILIQIISEIDLQKIFDHNLLYDPKINEDVYFNYYEFGNNNHIGNHIKISKSIFYIDKKYFQSFFGVTVIKNNYEMFHPVISFLKKEILNLKEKRVELNIIISFPFNQLNDFYKNFYEKKSTQDIMNLITKIRIEFVSFFANDAIRIFILYFFRKYGMIIRFSLIDEDTFDNFIVIKNKSCIKNKIDETKIDNQMQKKIMFKNIEGILKEINMSYDILSELYTIFHEKGYIEKNDVTRLNNYSFNNEKIITNSNSILLKENNKRHIGDIGKKLDTVKNKDAIQTNLVDTAFMNIIDDNINKENIYKKKKISVKNNIEDKNKNVLVINVPISKNSKKRKKNWGLNAKNLEEKQIDTKNCVNGNCNTICATKYDKKIKTESISFKNKIVLNENLISPKENKKQVIKENTQLKNFTQENLDEYNDNKKKKKAKKGENILEKINENSILTEKSIFKNNKEELSEEEMANVNEVYAQNKNSISTFHIENYLVKTTNTTVLNRKTLKSKNKKIIMPTSNNILPVFEKNDKKESEKTCLEIDKNKEKNKHEEKDFLKNTRNQELWETNKNLNKKVKNEQHTNTLGKNNDIKKVKDCEEYDKKKLLQDNLVTNVSVDLSDKKNHNSDIFYQSKLKIPQFKPNLTIIEKNDIDRSKSEIGKTKQNNKKYFKENMSTNCQEFENKNVEIFLKNKNDYNKSEKTTNSNFINSILNTEEVSECADQENTYKIKSVLVVENEKFNKTNNHYDSIISDNKDLLESKKNDSKERLETTNDILIKLNMHKNTFKGCFAKHKEAPDIDKVTKSIHNLESKNIENNSKNTEVKKIFVNKSKICKKLKKSYVNDAKIVNELENKMMILLNDISVESEKKNTKTIESETLLDIMEETSYKLNNLKKIILRNNSKNTLKDLHFEDNQYSEEDFIEENAKINNKYEEVNTINRIYLVKSFFDDKLELSQRRIEYFYGNLYFLHCFVYTSDLLFVLKDQNNHEYKFILRYKYFLNSRIYKLSVFKPKNINLSSKKISDKNKNDYSVSLLSTYFDHEIFLQHILFYNTKNTFNEHQANNTNALYIDAYVDIKTEKEKNILIRISHTRILIDNFGITSYEIRY